MGGVFIDPLYGAFSLPWFVEDLLRVPEIQRLREIRLLNINPFNIASLGEVTRFSHTLGLLHLVEVFLDGHKGALIGKDATSLRLAAALHDIGTPPFGHLVETLLSSSGWRHEAVVEDIILGRSSKQNKYFQIYWGCELGAYRSMRTLNESLGTVDLPLIFAAIRGAGPVGALLSGHVDLDNIDNVFRMSSYLGLRYSLGMAEELVHTMQFSDGQVAFPVHARELLEGWIHARRQTYETLLFNYFNFAAKALLTKALEIAFAEGRLGREDWFFTDALLLRHLYKFKRTRRLIQRVATARLPPKVDFYWLEHTESIERKLMHPAFIRELEGKLAPLLDRPCDVYVISEKGAFSKDVVVAEQTSAGRRQLVLSRASRSILVGLFIDSEGPPGQEAVTDRMRERVRSTFTDMLGDEQLNFKTIPSTEPWGEHVNERTLFA
jgi:hypothetical protein